MNLHNIFHEEAKKLLAECNSISLIFTICLSLSLSLSLSLWCSFDWSGMKICVEFNITFLNISCDTRWRGRRQSHEATSKWILQDHFIHEVRSCPSIDERCLYFTYVHSISPLLFPPLHYLSLSLSLPIYQSPMFNTGLIHFLSSIFSLSFAAQSSYAHMFW